MNKPNPSEKTFFMARHFDCRQLAKCPRAVMFFCFGLLLFSGCSHVTQQGSSPFKEAVATIKQSFSSPAPAAAVPAGNVDQVVDLPQSPEVGLRQPHGSSHQQSPFQDTLAKDMQSSEQLIESYESRIPATSVGHQLTDFSVAQAAYQQTWPSNSSPITSPTSSGATQRENYLQSSSGSPMPGQSNFQPMSRYENQPTHPSVQVHRAPTLQQRPFHARMSHPSQMEPPAYARYQAGMNQYQRPEYAHGQPVSPQFPTVEPGYQHESYVPPYGPPQHYADQMMTSYDAPLNNYSYPALNDDSRNLANGIGLHGSSLRQPPQTANELALEFKKQNELLHDRISKLNEQIGKLEKEVKKQKLLVKKTRVQLNDSNHENKNLQQANARNRIQIQDLEKQKSEIEKKADLALKEIEKQLDTMLMSTISQTPDP